MKNRYIRILCCMLLLFSLGMLEGCSNAHWGTSMGVNMHFGPSGPMVTPSFNIGVYNGGRW